MESSSPLTMRILRTVQAVFSVIVLSLSAYVVNWYDIDSSAHSPSQINFLLFASLFSLLSVGFLKFGLTFMTIGEHSLLVISVEMLNVIFWFAGFIALGVFLSGLPVCSGSVCGAARADTVFASFLFVAWAATAALLSKDVFAARFRHGGRGGPGRAAKDPV